MGSISIDQHRSASASSRRAAARAHDGATYCTVLYGTPYEYLVALGTGLLVGITRRGITYEIESKLSQNKTSDRVALLIAWHSVVPILFKDSVILALTF